MGEAFSQKARHEDGAAFLAAVSPRAEEALEGRWGLCSQGRYESVTSVSVVCLCHGVPKCVCDRV